LIGHSEGVILVTNEEKENGNNPTEEALDSQTQV
jgi:hypothetical protein